MTARASAAGKPDVCLVSMPYAELARPPLAVGLLKGILTGAGIRTVVAQADIWFAEKVSLPPYQLCSVQIPPHFLLGEWTFAEAAFPGAPRRDEEYLRHMAAALSDSPVFGADDGTRLITTLRSLRTAATQFVDHAARRILATSARVVGCTSTFQQHVASLAVLRRIHELDPDVITMMGGANCETIMGQTTHRCFPWVDYVVSGEADGLITDLCGLALARGRDVAPELLPAGVLGPRHREPGRDRLRIQASLPRALFRDLDGLPIPDFGDYFDELAASQLRVSIRPGLPLETSRGCWWGASHQCTFCGLNGSSMSFRSKSPERVLAEIEELEERYGVSNFEVVDNILDMSYFKTLLPRLAVENRPRRLFYEVKANLSRKHLETLVSAGITWVQPGIESLSSDVLRLMDKGVRAWQNLQLLKWSRELGLRLSWSMLWGFPGERDEDYQEIAGWLPMLEHLQPPSSLLHLRYDRYSVYHQNAKQLGMILMPVRAMSYVYPLAPADLDGLTYFFTTEAGPGPLDVNVTARGELAERRPGILAVGEAVSQWRTEFLVARPPILSMVDRDGVLDIVDSRRCARQPRVTLSGAVRAVCLACDTAPRGDHLAAILGSDFGIDVPADELAAIVARLSRDGLILPIDGRLVGLAVRDAVPALPHYTEFPGGHIYLDQSQDTAQSGRQAERLTAV